MRIYKCISSLVISGAIFYGGMMVERNYFSTAVQQVIPVSSSGRSLDLAVESIVRTQLDDPTQVKETFRKVCQKYDVKNTYINEGR